MQTKYITERPRLDNTIHSHK